MDQAQRQLVLNQLGNGPSVLKLIRAGMDPGVLRPYIGDDGNSYIALNTGKRDENGNFILKEYAVNTPAVLRREDWLDVDREVAWQAKTPLVFAAAVKAANQITLPNGFGTIAIQHTVADTEADAVLSMDPVRVSERSRPVMDAVHIPLPVWHSDGNFTARETAVSANSGIPLDTVQIRAAGRKIGEGIEKMYLGTTASFSYAGGTIYGALSHPARVTMNFTSPQAGGWTPATLFNEMLQALEAMRTRFYTGPYQLFVSGGWGPYLDMDYSATYQGDSLRNRLLKIEKIQSIKTVDYMTDFKMILIQMDAKIIEGVVGMPIVTVQWEEAGGQQLNYKVMTIDVPRIRADYSGKTGILDISAGTPSTTTTTTTTSTTTT